MNFLRHANRLRLCSFSVLATCLPGAALANNIGENVAWQFSTTGDKVNRAVLEDMRLKRSSGYYSAPVYNTTIDRQYNCTVSSVSTGNQGVSSAVGTSSSAQGNKADAAGNSDTTAIDVASANASASASGTQKNLGAVNATTVGGVSNSTKTSAYQVLNTEQGNSGAQSSAVSGSMACQFAAQN